MIERMGQAIFSTATVGSERKRTIYRKPLLQKNMVSVFLLSIQTFSRDQNLLKWSDKEKLKLHPLEFAIACACVTRLIFISQLRMREPNQNTGNCARTFIAGAPCYIYVSRAIDVESVLLVVDGNWSPWSEWSGCGAGLCGGNKKVRTRSCTNPQPTGGGKKCPGDSSEEAICPGNVKNVIRDKMQTVFFRKTVSMCVSVCFCVFVHEKIKVTQKKLLQRDDNLLPCFNFFF